MWHNNGRNVKGMNNEVSFIVLVFSLLEWNRHLDKVALNFTSLFHIKCITWTTNRRSWNFLVKLPPNRTCKSYSIEFQWGQISNYLHLSCKLLLPVNLRQFSRLALYSTCDDVIGRSKLAHFSNFKISVFSMRSVFETWTPLWKPNESFFHNIAILLLYVIQLQGKWRMNDRKKEEEEKEACNSFFSLTLALLRCKITKLISEFMEVHSDSTCALSGQY